MTLDLSTLQSMNCTKQKLFWDKQVAKQYKEQWEEANLLRLIYISNQAYEILSGLFTKTLIAINVLLFITYQAAKGLLMIIKLLLLTEPGINRIERDETWIFRQIK